jgi:hypothetical protein
MNPEDQNEDEDLNAGTNDGDDDDQQSHGTKQKEHEALIEQQVNERLAKMKKSVDGAYTKMDALVKENTRLKEAAQANERKKLESEGKHVEAAKLQITELAEKNSILQERLLGLTRDRELEKSLTGLEFRNDFAKQTAFDTLVRDLVQDDDGSWVHKSGSSVKDYIKTFAKDPNWDFLFKPKENTGTGTPTTKTTSTGTRPKSLAGMTTEELLAAAAAGKLGSLSTY